MSARLGRYRETAEALRGSQNSSGLIRAVEISSALWLTALSGLRSTSKRQMMGIAAN